MEENFLSASYKEDSSDGNDSDAESIEHRFQKALQFCILELHSGIGRESPLTWAHQKLLEEDALVNNSSTISEFSPIPESTKKCTLDIYSMSADELIESICTVNTYSSEFNNRDICDYMSLYEIDYIKSLLTDFSNALLDMHFPKDIKRSNNMSKIDVFDFHLNMSLAFILFMFKNEDFLSFSCEEQLCLLSSGLLRCIVSVGLFTYKQKTSFWALPVNLKNSNFLNINISDLSRILPHYFIMRVYKMMDISHKLQYDWVIGILTMLALFYVPQDDKIAMVDEVVALRDRYINLIFKYLKWKHKGKIANLVFPDILKLLDIVMKHSAEIETIELDYSCEEIDIIQQRLNSLSSASVSLSSSVTFEKINNSLVESLQNKLYSTVDNIAWSNSKGTINNEKDETVSLLKFCASCSHNNSAVVESHCVKTSFSDPNLNNFCVLLKQICCKSCSVEGVDIARVRSFMDKLGINFNS